MVDPINLKTNIVNISNVQKVQDAKLRENEVQQQQLARELSRRDQVQHQQVAGSRKAEGGTVRERDGRSPANDREKNKRNRSKGKQDPDENENGPHIDVQV
jgi:hypothetical protein